MIANKIKIAAALLLAGLMTLTACSPAAVAEIPVNDADATPYTARLAGVDDENAVSVRTPTDKWFAAPEPTVFAVEPAEKTMTPAKGDLYVSTTGDDDNGDGSFEHPFATLERAKVKVSELIKEDKIPEGGIEVCIMAGTYRVTETLNFRYKDSGTEKCPITYRAYGDGKVIITAAVPIDNSDFHPVTEMTSFSDEGVDKAAADTLSRFSEDAKENILIIDLYKYEISLAASKLCSFGTSNILGGNGRYSGVSGQLYVDEAAMTLARYPDDGTLLTSGITTKAPEDTLSYNLSADTLERAKSWKSKRDIWVLGMFVYDYFDSAVPATFDLDAGYFTAKDAPSDGMGTASYYFYNIPEELDRPGEWYLDRENMLMYLYPPESGLGEVEFSTLGMNIIELENCDNITFEGLTLRGVRNGSGIIVHGDNVTVRNCRICDVGGAGIDGSGKGLTVSGCEIKYTGGAAISFSGGDKATLTPTEVLIENNDIHHWGLLRRSFGTAVELTVYGSAVRNNEIHNSTAPAIGVAGCDNVIEYNIVRDCTTYGSDCGSWYTGSSWTSGGNEIRYNCFFNIGSPYATPAAIYWDDGMSYQRAYCNLFVNVTGNGFSLGGGFSNVICNNIFVNIGRSPIYYDGRSIMGYKSGNSFFSLNGFVWNLYQSTPYRTDVWRESFPLLAEILQGEEDGTIDSTNPHFGFIPAFSLMNDNIVVTVDSRISDTSEINDAVGTINVYAQKYSTVEKNMNFGDMSAVGFKDYESGDYRLRPDSTVYELCPDFKTIPYWRIGRY